MRVHPIQGIKQKMSTNINETNASAATATKAPHPERFWVDYIIEADSAAHARKLGRELCLEQTVELPGDIDAVKNVEAFTVGTVENVQEINSTSNTLYRVTVAFPNATAGDELTQFLNVVFGNTSLKKGVSVANISLSKQLQSDEQMFPGPKFGIQGLRNMLGVSQAPILCTALKPMGSSAAEFGKMAYALAKGGIDIIKDDHGLANQVWAPFAERVAICAKAVHKANEETGKKCVYAPCLNAPVAKILERARYAKQVGGLLFIVPVRSHLLEQNLNRVDNNIPILCQTGRGRSCHGLAWNIRLGRSERIGS